jgi:hypothetical protein
MKRGVVFDMDKCIGYFTQIALYQDIIEDLSRPLKVNEYFELFDIFPEIFRPGIFGVFKYLLKEKKKKNLQIILYTNNNGPPSWATNIRKYIEHKIKRKLFDRTIKGWKFDNKIVEEKRGGYAKSLSDLLKCTKLTKKDRIIFFDDRDEHYKMIHRNVDYQVVKPYMSGIHHEDFVDKFMKSKLNKKLKVNKEELIRECNSSGYRPKLSLVKYSNNDIMKPLREFLKSTKKTRKQRRFKKKKTRKGGGSTNHRIPPLSHLPPRTVRNPRLVHTPREAELRMAQLRRQDSLRRHYNILHGLAPQSARDFRAEWRGRVQQGLPVTLTQLIAELGTRIEQADIAAID